MKIDYRFICNRIDYIIKNRELYKQLKTLRPIESYYTEHCIIKCSLPRRAGNTTLALTIYDKFKKLNPIYICAYRNQIELLEKEFKNNYFCKTEKQLDNYDINDHELIICDCPKYFKQNIINRITPNSKIKCILMVGGC